MYSDRIIIKKEKYKEFSAKRVDIVKVQLVKESSLLYKNWSIQCPKNGYDLMTQFLGNVDREYVVVLCLDTKNQPTSLNVCHIGSLNASLIHPREVFKPAILSNSTAVMIGHTHPSGNPSP